MRSPAASHIDKANEYLNLAIEALIWAKMTTDHPEVQTLCRDLQSACARVRERAKGLRLERERT